MFSVFFVSQFCNLLIICSAGQEFEIDKTHNIKGPEDVAAMGIAKYNQLCRDIVMRYAGEWEQIVTRTGRWIGE